MGGFGFRGVKKLGFSCWMNVLECSFPTSSSNPDLALNPRPAPSWVLWVASPPPTLVPCSQPASPVPMQLTSDWEPACSPLPTTVEAAVLEAAHPDPHLLGVLGSDCWSSSTLPTGNSSRLQACLFPSATFCKCSCFKLNLCYVFLSLHPLEFSVILYVLSSLPSLETLTSWLQ